MLVKTTNCEYPKWKYSHGGTARRPNVVSTSNERPSASSFRANISICCHEIDAVKKYGNIRQPLTDRLTRSDRFVKSACIKWHGSWH